MNFSAFISGLLFPLYFINYNKQLKHVRKKIKSSESKILFFFFNVIKYYRNTNKNGKIISTYIFQILQISSRFNYSFKSINHYIR